MSDDFCLCDSCGNEVQSVYTFDFMMQEYNLIDGYSWCDKCKAIKKESEVHWKHVEYGLENY